MTNVDDVLKKYDRKLSKQIDSTEINVESLSKEYSQFKEDMMPSQSIYEKWARTFGGLLVVNLSEKDKVAMQRSLDSAHLEITPSQVVSFSFFSALITFFIGILLFTGYFFILGNINFIDYLMGPAGIFLFLIFISSMFIFYYVYSSPKRMAKLWKLKAGSQMVPCILYVVVYMKHTSNLERAIGFASQHLKQPLSLDLKKIFWNVETGRFSTIKESLDNYLKTWEIEALEFVEAFHLIESSLFEPSDSRRIQTLEKALQVILDGVYEKMMVFSRTVRSPLTNLYMLGIVLPTLGLALLPLASTLLGDMIKSYHIFILFNLIVPFFVYYMTSQIMLQRPGGYGESDILEMNPRYPEYKSKKPYLISFLICFPLFIFGVLPFLFQWGVFESFGWQKDYSLAVFGLDSLETVMLFDFKTVGTSYVGPFGIGALILSLFIPLSIALFFSISYKLKTKNLIKDRDYTKQLEAEFTNSLFQLGNRLGDGMPAEMAFARVAESTKGQKTSEFFRIVNLNLHQAGMSLERALFDPKRGAIIYFPSQLISTSMRILLESVKKGLIIAAHGLMSISEYIKNIQKVTQRLNDLLAEVVSDMKSNMVFLAPLLAGIVVGLSAMIAFILNKLLTIFSDIGEGGEISGLGNVSDFLGLFDILSMIPPYFMQIAIGVYLIEIIFILTDVLVTIDSGDDKLKRTNDIGKNLNKGIIMYVVITLVSSVLLSFLAAIALSGLG